MLFSHSTGFLHSSKCSQEQATTWAPSAKTGAQDRRSSMFDCWAATLVWFGSLLHFSSSMQNSLFVSSGHSCHIASCNTQLASLIIFPPRLKLPEAGTPALHILLHCLPSTSRSLSEENPTNGFAFPHRRSNPHHLPQPLPCVHYGGLVSSHSRQGICLGRTRMVSRPSGVNRPSGFC